MSTLRYEFWTVGEINELTQARECLRVAWHLATLHWDEPNDSAIAVPLQALELSQGGILVFVQTVHRLAPGLELYAEIGARSADVVVQFYWKLVPSGSLRVRFPLNAYEPGLRRESIVMTMEADRSLFEWILPRARQRPINVGWQECMAAEIIPKTKFFASTPLNEW